jgi:hypothetical protein
LLVADPLRADADATAREMSAFLTALLEQCPHLPGTFADDLVDHRRRSACRQRGRRVRDCCEHGFTFPASVAAPAVP